MKPSLCLVLAGALAGALADATTPITAHADDAAAAEPPTPVDGTDGSDGTDGRRLRASFRAGWRMAPGRSPADVAQGLVLGAEVAYRLRSGADVFARSEVVGLDQLAVWRISGAGSSERARAATALPPPAVEMTSVVGVRRRLGRVTVEAAVGAWSRHDQHLEPVARAPMAQLGATVRVGCVRRICLDAGAAVRTTVGPQGPGWAILPTFALTSP